MFRKARALPPEALCGRLSFTELAGPFRSGPGTGAGRRLRP